MMRKREERRERSVGRVRFAVAADLAEENRLSASYLSVDDDRAPDDERLRHGDVAGVGEMLGLKIHLELVRNAERVARRGERIESLKEQEQEERGSGDLVPPRGDTRWIYR